MAFPIALAILATAPLYAQDAPVFPPGSHVGLVPPAGFVVSRDFMGFMDEQAGASIIINELPGDSYRQLRAGFTAGRLAARGMTMLGACDNVTTAAESVCHRVTQEAGGLTFQKWLLLAQTGQKTALVVVTLPDVALDNGAYSSSVVEASLSTIAFGTDVAVSARDALPFSIEEGALLKFDQAIGGSGALFLGEAAAGAPQPIWVVAASLGTRAEARQSAFSRRAFEQMGTVSNVTVAAEQTLAVGPLEGHLFEGSGQDEDTGGDVYVYQAILVDDADKYYRLVGIAPAGQRAIYRAEFLRLTQTLAPR